MAPPSTPPDLPTIVTTDLSNAPPSSPPPGQQQSPSSPPATPPSGGGSGSGFVPGHRQQDSLTVPGSPLLYVPGRAPSLDSPSDTSAPSSPTLSFASSAGAPFATSVALRDNKPDAKSGGWGSSSDAASISTHGRKPSLSSYTTEPDAPANGAKMADGDESGSKEGNGPVDLTQLEADRRVIDDLGAFHFQPWELSEVVAHKDFPKLAEMGGTPAVLESLGTDEQRGLAPPAYEFYGHGGGGPPPLGRAGSPAQANGDERVRVYDKNVIPPKPTKNLFQLMWLALQDTVLIILSVAAVVSLALGIYSATGVKHAPVPCYNPETDDYSGRCQEPQVEWVEGVAIIVAILIVVLVGAGNDYQKELQFKKLNAKKEDRTVKAKRDGREQFIDVKDVLVGDILYLETGEILPVDGIYLRGHNLRCDESGATGESDAIKKCTFGEMGAYLKEHGDKDASKGKSAKQDCFLLSGAKVLEGVGEYVVTSVGPQSFNGKILLRLRTDQDPTPLQTKLNRLAELIAKLASAAGLILFIALMIRFLVGLKTDPNRSADEKGQDFIQVFVISVTVIVVAVPEGLPLAVTLALAFATKRMTKQNLLVRLLASCETMANASVICTDKTGTLTQNVMSVVAGSIGIHCKFVDRLEENEGRANANEEGEGEGSRKTPRTDFAIDMAKLSSVTGGALRKLLFDSIAINSTAFEDVNRETGETEFVGSKTETALLRFIKEQGWADWREVRDGADIVQMVPFSSERKAMGVIVKMADGKHRLYLKGASEILVKACTKHVVIAETGSEDDAGAYADGEIDAVEFDDASRNNIDRTIIFYANQSLRTISICYRDLPSWPPKGANVNEEGEVDYKDLAKDLTLVAVTAIEDPLRPSVSEAVAKCQKAGVMVKMCTGDNVLTARSIAIQCGIFTPGGLVMEGVAFRALSSEQKKEVVPRLQVLARSSPQDKEDLVSALKELGEVVGVTGDGTNDAPALKKANVGFSMGIAGTEVAKEASDIVLMDDNFASIVSAIMWGRCVNDSVKKFLQFQLSVNITAVVITFVTAVASNSEESVLSAVQLLWVNLIMDTFAALALATDPATPALLNRKPDRKDAPLITVGMMKMITIQAIFQIVVAFVLHFAGRDILGLMKGYSNETEEGQYNAQGAELKALVFNTFVWCQIFNQLNCRRLDNKFNVLEGFFRNYWFMAIFLIMAGGQTLIVFVGGAAFQVTRLGGRDWAISIIIGLISLPIGALVRCIPNEPLERFAIKWKIIPDPDALPLHSPMADEDAKDKEVQDPVNDSLAVLGAIRGGRLRSSSIVQRSRYSKPEKGSHLRGLVILPTIVASGVGASPHSYRPTERGSFSDPAGTDPSRSTAALWSGKVQIHPQTNPEDAVWTKFGSGSPSARSRSGSSTGDDAPAPSS